MLLLHVVEVSAPTSLIVSAVSAVPAPNDFERFSAEFRELTSAGDVILDRGTCKLAGLRLRPVSETKELELLKVVNEIITRESCRVDVVLHSESKRVVVFYKQRIFYSDLDHPIAVLNKMISPKVTDGTINELLLATGAANYDAQTGAGFMPSDMVERCENVADKFELAKWAI